MAQLEFTEQIEKLLEVTAIVILGTVLLAEPMLKYAGQSLLIAGLLLLVIRPLEFGYPCWGAISLKQLAV